MFGLIFISALFVAVFLAVTALGCMPIVVWNAGHDWLSVRHTLGQSGVGDGVKPRPTSVGNLVQFVGAQAGLGMLLLQYNNNMQVGGVFAILFILGVIGFLLNMIMRGLEGYFCFWARRTKDFGRSGG